MDMNISVLTIKPCLDLNSIYPWLDEEILFEHTNSTAEDEEFDASVKYLEELLLDEHFQSMLESFYESNCGIMRSLHSILR